MRLKASEKQCTNLTWARMTDKGIKRGIGIRIVRFVDDEAIHHLTQLGNSMQSNGAFFALDVSFREGMSHGLQYRDTSRKGFVKTYIEDERDLIVRIMRISKGVSLNGMQESFIQRRFEILFKSLISEVGVDISREPIKVSKVIISHEAN